eukprot:10564558-Karenia_brevis.AAC.1
MLHKKADGWKRKLEDYFNVTIQMFVADPPFQTDDIDCKGYWLKHDAKEHKQRVKKLKSQVSSALVTLLNAVERVRPKLIVGQGQGGTVAAASTLPLILERACRDRAVTQHQMYTFRQAWSRVTAILVIDRVKLPTSNNQKW